MGRKIAANLYRESDREMCEAHERGWRARIDLFVGPESKSYWMRGWAAKMEVRRGGGERAEAQERGWGARVEIRSGFDEDFEFVEDRRERVARARR